MYHAQQINQLQEPDCSMPKGLSQAERDDGISSRERRGQRKPGAGPRRAGSVWL